MRRNHSVDYSRRYYLESYCGHIPAQVVSADCMWKDLTKVDSAALEITDIDEYSKAQIRPADLPLHGYMPLRGDCDVEYKDTAEDLLAEMELPPIEDIAGRSLKRQILRLYNGKLQERENRRCFFIKRGLFGTASHHGQKRSRAFARLDEVGGRKLMEGVVQSTRLRERLVQLASQCS